MPDLNSIDMEQINLPTGHFGFTATRLADLQSAEYTLCTVVVDESGSTNSFKGGMEDCIKEVVKACKYSSRADNLMLRLVAFDHNHREIHGFKLLENCNPDDYSGCLTGNGSTALYDNTFEAIEATAKYGESLFKQDLDVNGIVIVITDGGDNASKFTKKNVAESLKSAISGEKLESLVSILVGVNITDPSIGIYLKDFETQGGFTQYVELADATAKTLAKLAAFVSRSISSQSKSLNSGGPSQPLVF